MKKELFAKKLLIATILFIAHSVSAAELTHPSLRQELLEMETRDQEVRKPGKQPDFAKWQEVDASNQNRLKEIVEQYGWPTFAMVGEDGARAAWLLAQHSDTDKAFQRKVLALMEPLVKAGQASGKHLAYLHDRTHYPQRYGTQGTCVTREEWQPFEIEEFSQVDERRRSVGLPSLAEYAAGFKTICGDPHGALKSADDPRRTVPLVKK